MIQKAKLKERLGIYWSNKNNFKKDRIYDPKRQCKVKQKKE